MLIREIREIREIRGRIFSIAVVSRLQKGVGISDSRPLLRNANELLRRPSFLIDRQRVVLQLQNRKVDGS